MYINTFKYKPEDVSCVLCTEYVKKLGCTALSCPCLAERMEAGTVGYAEAVAELFPYRPRLTARIMRLVESFPGTMWQDDAHRKRMETLRLLLGNLWLFSPLLKAVLPAVRAQAGARAEGCDDLCEHATRAVTLVTCTGNFAGGRARTLTVFVG